MIDHRSATWAEVAKRAEGEIARLILELKNESLDANGTTRVRARIRAFEDVLSWAMPAEEPPIEGSVSWQI